MRFRQLNTLIGFAALCFPFGGCISVNLSQGGDYTSAREVVFKAPRAPFEEIIVVKADQAWRNPSTGNTITYLSECGEVSSLKIPEVAATLMRSQGLKINSQKKTQVSGFDAVESEGFQKEGTHTVRVKVITFKTHECLYNLAYLGPEKNFEQEERVFTRFKESFRGP